ncbi:BMP family protein [Moorella naiadis]|uniref:BMP family protein n=1 Tax=Moorella naiadis (nom. illeg.) TaxID=3093670 RepID=UPI003D9CABBE
MRLKLITLLIISTLTLALIAGCGGGKQNNPAPNNNQAADSQQLKVALLLPGPINDMGWNASAYEGLKKVEKDYNAQVAYRENVAQSDMEEAFRAYAMQGYNVVIGHGFQFGDAAKKVAPQFPKVKFVVTSSNIHQDPNLASVNIDNEMQGFLMGAVAGLMTKSGTVAALGGQQIPPIIGSVEGFAKGAKYVNPQVKVVTTYTGSFDDVNKMKETALAIIENQGADIIMANANQAGLGAIQAAQQKKVLAIGSNTDQNAVAPDTVLVSGIKSVPVLVSFVVQKIQDGSFQPQFFNLGVKEKAVFLSPWHGFDSKVPAEVKAKLDQITKDLGDGKIDLSKLSK